MLGQARGWLLGKSGSGIPEVMRKSLCTELDRKVLQEKLLSVIRFKLSVLKLTQVGGVSIPRRSREFTLRNSANFVRNFGIRTAQDGDGTCSLSQRLSRREMALATVY